MIDGWGEYKGEEEMLRALKMTSIDLSLRNLCGGKILLTENDSSNGTTTQPKGREVPKPVS